MSAEPSNATDAPLPDTGVKTSQQEQDDASVASSVKLWCDRIKDAKEHWKRDFTRMKENMEFCGGIQWKGQKTIDDEAGRYIANITLRTVNEGVAALYARNPKAEFVRRPRLDYQLWDGKMETLVNAFQALQAQTMSGGVPSMEAMAVLQDFNQGQQRRQLVDKIGSTLEIAYQWQVDEQEPDFKEQMKDMVAYARVCGVAYVKMGFEREYTSSIDTMDVQSQIGDRVKRMQHLLSQVADDKVDDSSYQVQEIKQLLASLEQSAQSGETQDVSERLVFSFPSPLSIIVDPKAKSLKDFNGARWIAEEFIMPLDEVNEFFETDISATGEFTHYQPDGAPAQVKDNDPLDRSRTPMCCLWQVYDMRTKSTFFVVDGYKKYVQEPGPVEPCIRRFWPVFALTFNNVVVTPNQKITIYPPSDVQNMKSAQKEWNRTRDSLRGKRKANATRYMTGAQWLTDDDRDKIEDGVENALIEVQGAPSGSDVEKLIRPFPVTAIDMKMYDTGPLQQDILLVNGSQQANLGPLSGATATESSIAEQSKMSTTSSDIDNLNSILSAMAKAGGEMLLREMSKETIIRIVGPGAVWPENNREDFINEILLDAVAGSSGRPNSQQDQQKFERITPLLLQAGANPMAIIREAVKVLDFNLDPQDFFPLPMPPPQGSPQQQGTPAPQGAASKSPAKKPAPPPQPGQLSRPGQPPSPMPQHA